MKTYKSNNKSNNKVSRRKFINTFGATTAGLILAPYIKSDSIFAYGYDNTSSYISKVALAGADNYERAFVRQRVEHLFEELGGLADVVQPGNTVALKINLVGGASPKQCGRILKC